MTIKMRLDTEGLRELIKGNPELEIEIGKEVLRNIQDDSIRGKVEAQIQTCLRGMVVQTGTWPTTYKAKAPELIQAVQLAAEQIVKESVGAVLEKAVAAEVQKHLALTRAQGSREMKALMKELLTPEMARELMREKILL